MTPHAGRQVGSFSSFPTAVLWEFTGADPPHEVEFLSLSVTAYRDSQTTYLEVLPLHGNVLLNVLSPWTQTS